jgi:hypothetical protein
MFRAKNKTAFQSVPIKIRCLLHSVLALWTLAGPELTNTTIDEDDTSTTDKWITHRAPCARQCVEKDHICRRSRGIVNLTGCAGRHLDAS